MYDIGGYLSFIFWWVGIALIAFEVFGPAGAGLALIIAGVLLGYHSA